MEWGLGGTEKKKVPSLSPLARIGGGGDRGSGGVRGGGREAAGRSGEDFLSNLHSVANKCQTACASVCSCSLFAGSVLLYIRNSWWWSDE